MYEIALAELRARWRDGNRYVGKDDICRWSGLCGLSATKVLDELAVELSSDFFVGFLGFDFTMGAANALHGALLELVDDDPNFVWAETFYEFYCACDHIEMMGTKDRELIREFLQKYRMLSD